MSGHLKLNSRAAYKPDSVPEAGPPWMAIHLDGELPSRSCCRPEFLGRSSRATIIA